MQQRGFAFPADNWHCRIILHTQLSFLNAFPGRRVCFELQILDDIYPFFPWKKAANH
jgi:hypothetical protein